MQYEQNVRIYRQTCTVSQSRELNQCLVELFVVLHYICEIIKRMSNRTVNMLVLDNFVILFLPLLNKTE